MREDGGLNEIESVGGQKLLQDGARFAHQRGPLFNLSHKSGDDQQGGKEHEHAGIGGGFGRIDDVVGQGLNQRFPDSGKIALIDVTSQSRAFARFTAREKQGIGSGPGAAWRRDAGQSSRSGDLALRTCAGVYRSVQE